MNTPLYSFNQLHNLLLYSVLFSTHLIVFCSILSQWVRHRNEDKHKNPSETPWVGMQDGDDTWAEPTGGSGWRWCCQRKMTVYKSATRGSHGPQDSSLRRPQSSSDLLICTSMTGSVWPQLPCCFTRSVWGIQCLIASSLKSQPLLEWLIRLLGTSAGNHQHVQTK